MFYDDSEYQTTPPPYRILELEPGHFDSTVCTLCGAFGENVDWYWAYSQESFRAFTAVHHALKQINDWPDGMDLHVAAEEIAEEVDPIAHQNQDEMPICTDCAGATPRDLRRRIREYADMLDEAGYSTAHCVPGDDYLADHTLRDRGLWVRRHIGYELVVSNTAEVLPV